MFAAGTDQQQAARSAAFLVNEHFDQLCSAAAYDVFGF